MKTKLLLLVTSFIPVIAVANPKDFDKVQLKAHAGDAKACFKLADYYHHGVDGLVTNLDSAAYYYGISANAGNKKAIPLAGLTYRELYKKTRDKAKGDLSIKYFSMIVSVKDIEKLSPTLYGKNPNAMWEIMQAENYYDQSNYNNAQILYYHNREDAISIIRLESFKPMPQPFLQEPPQDLKKYTLGINGNSADTLDFRDVIEFAKKQQIDICIFKEQWEDAVQYHQQYSNDDKAKSWTWLGNYIRDNNMDTKDNSRTKRCYEYATRLGDSNAYLPLAQIHYQKNDYSRALPIALKAVEYNDAIEENRIAAYSYYRMNQKDKAFPYWNRLKDLGFTAANICLGECYQNGLGCDKNEDLAIEHYEQGLKKNNWSWAQYNLGTLYEKKMWDDFMSAITIDGDQGENTSTIDYKAKAIYWYNEAVKQNVKPAMAALANLIQSTDKERAVALADACMDDKDCKPKAWKIKVQLVGDSLYSSLVAAKNYQELKNQRRFLASNGERDLEICKTLAQQNYITETVDLAYAYLNGTLEYYDFANQHHQYNVEKDTVIGFNLLLKAYELQPGNTDLKKEIVNRYTYGRGVKQDLDKAKQIFGANYSDYYFWNWKTWQIQKGDIDAVINTFSAEDEKELYMSNNEALKWLLNAATKGNNKQKADALYYLGMVYEKGRCGVEINGAKAISYFKQSANLNDSGAYYHLGWIYKTGACDVKLNLALASQYYKKCYDLSGDQDAYYNYLHCWNRSH